MKKYLVFFLISIIVGPLVCSVELANANCGLELSNTKSRKGIKKISIANYPVSLPELPLLKSFADSLLKKDVLVFYGKNSKEVDFIVCEGLEPIKIINVTLEAESEKTLKREIDSLHYFHDKYKIPGELVSLYPCKVPESINFRLAHRYM